MDKLKGYKNSQMGSNVSSKTSLEEIFDTAEKVVVHRKEKTIRQREERFPCRDCDVITDIKFQTKNVKRVYLSINNTYDYEFDTKLNFPIPVISTSFSASYLKIVPIDPMEPFECIVACNKNYIFSGLRNSMMGKATYQNEIIARDWLFMIKHAPRHVKYWVLRKKLDGIKSDIKEYKLLNLIISYSNPVQLYPKNSISIFDFYIPLSVKLTEKNGNIPKIIKNIWDFYDDKQDEKIWIN